MCGSADHLKVMVMVGNSSQRESYHVTDAYNIVKYGLGEGKSTVSLAGVKYVWK